MSMKHIYIRVTEEEYTCAKRIGFFEITDRLRNLLKKIIEKECDK